MMIFLVISCLKFMKVVNMQFCCWIKTIWKLGTEVKLWQFFEYITSKREHVYSKQILKYHSCIYTYSYMLFYRTSWNSTIPVPKQLAGRNASTSIMQHHIWRLPYHNHMAQRWGPTASGGRCSGTAAPVCEQLALQWSGSPTLWTLHLYCQQCSSCSQLHC